MGARLARGLAGSRQVRLPTAASPAPSAALARAVHAVWSSAGLGFLALWLAGRLRCFAGGGARPARLLAALAPLFAAGWVGLTRIQTNRRALGVLSRAPPAIPAGRAASSAVHPSAVLADCPGCPRLWPYVPHPPLLGPCRHHPSDVLAAYALGLLLAVAFYLQPFHSPLSPRAGALREEEQEAPPASGGGGGRERSGYLPLAAEPAAPAL